MTNVLAAIDNSPTAGPVLDAAVALAAILHADVQAVHVREGTEVNAERAANNAGVSLTVLEDPVSKALIEAAKARGVEAVVVGAKNIASSAATPGHVTLETIATIGKPVLVVPPDAHRPSRLRNVVLPLDGKLQTAEGLSKAIEFASRHEMNVRVVHVHDESCLPPFEDQPQYEANAWAHEFVCRYCSGVPQDVEHLVDIRIGVPADEILAVSEECRADLIILAWKQDLSSGHAAVVRGLLERSSTPLLLYPLVDQS
jgi:nucleotide-binding universal stress UspA family protein